MWVLISGPRRSARLEQICNACRYADENYKYNRNTKSKCYSIKASHMIAVLTTFNNEIFLITHSIY